MCNGNLAEDVARADGAFQMIRQNVGWPRRPVITIMQDELQTFDGNKTWQPAVCVCVCRGVGGGGGFSF